MDRIGPTRQTHPQHLWAIARLPARRNAVQFWCRFRCRLVQLKASRCRSVTEMFRTYFVAINAASFWASGPETPKLELSERYAVANASSTAPCLLDSEGAAVMAPIIMLRPRTVSLNHPM